MDQDPRFNTFVDRMRGARCGFYSKSAGFVTWEFYDDDDEALDAVAEERGLDDASSIDPVVAAEIRRKNATAREKWMTLAAKQFIKRRKQFDKRMRGSSLGFITAQPLLSLFVVIVLAVVYWYWPIWDRVLIDVQADNYYSTLGLESGASKAEVKKAYRAMTKIWHPDHNPDCGMRCRNMMMKIQEAHDVLLERGSSEARIELLRKYQSALEHLVGLVFVRGFGMAQSTSDYFAFFTKWLYRTRFGMRVDRFVSHDTASFAVRLTFLVTFAALAAFFVTSHPLIWLQFFYLIFHLFKPNPAQVRDASIVRRSNFDVRSATIFIIAPTVAFHVGHFLLFEKYPRYDEFAFRLVMGFTYLTGHLTTYTPNLFDNVKMMKCTVPWPYLSSTGAGRSRTGAPSSESFRMTMLNFIWAEALILLNEIWAFSVQTPAVYRAVVFVVHWLFILQLFTLPRDSPILGKLQRRHLQQQQQQRDRHDEAEARSQSYLEQRNSRRAGVQLQRVTEREEGLINQLDVETTPWIGALPRKTATAVREEEALLSRNATDQGPKLQLFFHCDLRHVLIASVTQGTGGKQPMITVRRLIDDARGAAMIAREFGKNGLWPEPAAPAGGVVNLTQQKMDQAVQTAEENLGKLAMGRLNYSGYRRAVIARSIASMEPQIAATAVAEVAKFFALTAAAAFALFGLLIPHLPVGEPRYSERVPPHSAAQAVKSQRFSGVLPPAHELNSAWSAGIGTTHNATFFFSNDDRSVEGSGSKGSDRRRKMRKAFFEGRTVDLPLLIPDLFEALRTLYSPIFRIRSKTDAAAAPAPEEPQQQQQQQKSSHGGNNRKQRRSSQTK